jgi:IS5 family transposase
MIDLGHPLAVLASRMPWSQNETSLAPVFAHSDHKVRLTAGADMFGPTLAVHSAGVSNAGRPRLPIGLMVALVYPKRIHNESDEPLVESF